MSPSPSMPPVQDQPVAGCPLAVAAHVPHTARAVRTDGSGASPHPTPAIPVRRLLAASEAEAFAAFRRTVVADNPRGMGLTLAEEEARSLDGYRAQLSGRPPGGVFGLFIDDSLVATAGIVWPTAAPSGAHKAVLWGVATAPAWRGRGFARRLVAHAVAHAFAHGARRVYLSVYLPNPVARGLYESLGFVASGRELEVLRLGDEYCDIEYMSLAAADAAAARIAQATQPSWP